MKIELKKLAVYERMSDDTNAFCAELYINGTKCGSVSNDGNGGPNEIPHHPLVKEANQWCLSQPKLKTEYGELEIDLDLYISDLVEDFRKKKAETSFIKRMERAAVCAVIVHDPNDQTWFRTALKWKKDWPISRLLSHEKGSEVLKTQLKKLLTELKDGEVIFNQELQPLIKSLLGRSHRGRPIAPLHNQQKLNHDSDNLTQKI